LVPPPQFQREEGRTGLNRRALARAPIPPFFSVDFSGLQSLNRRKGEARRRYVISLAKRNLLYVWIAGLWGTGMSQIGSLAVFVLTIDAKDGARRVHAEEELLSFNLQGRFVEGPRKNDAIVSAIYSPFRNLLFAKRKLTCGEIAAYAGHRRAWKAFIEHGGDAALIFEDDFHVANQTRFKAVLAECLSLSHTWDIVKFFDFNPKRVVRRRHLVTTDLAAYKYPASGAVAYLISATAAQQLLKRSRIYRPIDEDLSWPWEFGLRVWSTQPNLVEEVSKELGGSLLESMRVANKAHRNLCRSVWANVLQGWKLVRAWGYHAKLGKQKFPTISSGF
jgi:GR25 family glycosyltransferase involved in LPS biosynthesis